MRSAKSGHSNSLSHGESLILSKGLSSDQMCLLANVNSRQEDEVRKTRKAFLYERNTGSSK